MSVVVTGPVRTLTAPPLQPSVPQPLLMAKPVTPVAVSVHDTRMVRWFSAMAATWAGAAGGVPAVAGWREPAVAGVRDGLAVEEAAGRLARGPLPCWPCVRVRAAAVPAAATATIAAS